MASADLSPRPFGTVSTSGHGSTAFHRDSSPCERFHFHLHLRRPRCRGFVADPATSQTVPLPGSRAPLSVPVLRPAQFTEHLGHSSGISWRCVSERGMVFSSGRGSIQDGNCVVRVTSRPLEGPLLAWDVLSKWASQEVVPVA